MREWFSCAAAYQLRRAPRVKLAGAGMGSAPPGNLPVHGQASASSLG